MDRSKTHNKLLNAAKESFWKYGYKRVTVEEICSLAGVSKMSFYRLYSNKLAIAKEVFGIEITQSLREYRKILDGPHSFAEKMEETIHFKMDQVDRIGQEFLKELLQYGGDEFHAFLQEKRIETEDMVNKSFTAAQKQGEIRKDINLDILPIISEHITLLATNPKLQEMYPNQRDLIREVSTFFFYGIISHPLHP